MSPQKKSNHHITAIASLLLLCAASATAQRLESAPQEVTQAMEEDPLPCPFALKWGQDPEQVVSWARKNQLTLKWIERPGDPSTTIEIDKNGEVTMPNAEFSKLRFRFINGHLVEAAIIYQREGTPKENELQAAKLVQEIQMKWGKGMDSAENTGNSDRSLTTTWKVSEGRFILLNVTQTLADSTGKQLWVGKVIYRHHALALLASQKD